MNKHNESHLKKETFIESVKKSVGPFVLKGFTFFLIGGCIYFHMDSLSWVLFWMAILFLLILGLFKASIDKIEEKERALLDVHEKVRPKYELKCFCPNCNHRLQYEIGIKRNL
jgi:hypothetical protein